jgi:hypothetical protein
MQPKTSRAVAPKAPSAFRRSPKSTVETVDEPTVEQPTPVVAVPEPTVLHAAAPTVTDDVEIDVSDLGDKHDDLQPATCPHCAGDIARLVQRAENRAWRKARVHYRQKLEREAGRPAKPNTADAVAALDSRLGDLEQAIALVVGRLTTAPQKRKS